MPKKKFDSSNKAGFIEDLNKAEMSQIEEFDDGNILDAVKDFDQVSSFLAFSPDAWYRVLWDILGFVIIGYQATIVPIRICFDEPATGFWESAEFFMDIYFGLDILVNFNTGFYDQQGLCLERKKFILNYLKTWFLPDLLASIPWTEVIELLFMQQDNSSSGDSTNNQRQQEVEQYSQAP